MSPPANPSREPPTIESVRLQQQLVERLTAMGANPVVSRMKVVGT